MMPVNVFDADTQAIVADTYNGVETVAAAEVAGWNCAFPNRFVKGDIEVLLHLASKQNLLRNRWYRRNTQLNTLEEFSPSAEGLKAALMLVLSGDGLPVQGEPVVERKAVATRYNKVERLAAITARYNAKQRTDEWLETFYDRLKAAVISCDSISENCDAMQDEMNEYYEADLALLCRKEDEKVSTALLKKIGRAQVNKALELAEDNAEAALVKLFEGVEARLQFWEER